MTGLSGSLGKQVVFRRVGNKTFVSAYPDFSSRKLSAKQKRTNQLMREANQQAKAIIADPKRRNAAQVRLNVPGNKLYFSLVGEYLRNAQKKQAV